MDITWTRGPIIGRGSTATVSIAVSNSGEIFAVKSADFSSSAFLQNEKSILSTLSSPHIVKYIGSDVTPDKDGLVYNLLMEYVSGGSLHDLIKKSGGKLPEPAIRSYTRQILRGLLYLHERGIVHCDLKSQNVLVEENGAVCKIADVGCAKPVSKSGFSGTPAFMAPEVARGEEQRFPADVWALGCTVIEMMAGSTPWPELNDVVAAMYKIGFSGESPEIPEVISGKGKDFLMGCLENDPKQRWTVEELLKHPFLDEDEDEEEESRLQSTSSPSTVLDQRFWNTCEEDSKSHSLSMDHDDPFADYSESWDSPADRIEQLAGDEFSSVPDWDTVDDGGWIEVRGDVLAETERRVGYGEEYAICVDETSSSSEAIEVVDEWIWGGQDRLYSLDDVTASLYFFNVAIQGNVIVYYYFSVGVQNVPTKKMFRNSNENSKEHLSVELQTL
ncbi:mitogen-activated protein kinase kinase kinase 16 [Raphanus sativus]|uniref:Mitogen-activated protein kinase kinase kinase 18 n=1 Tax=Raphanus sativus TaxID=3726 RepID=A0A9W3D5W7_RAPSA|nr:mitogen-activated protein kinase kinase kinase 18 [Raphanus sativus]KAJ4913289.1 mitogen-activated protein kinase kinase kinase 16 [Raphanus sativus]